MSIKRSREVDKEVEALAMANCLMLLSQIDKSTTNYTTGSRVFECKTCNRTFPSFQALGGHRASHKRPKLMAVVDLIDKLPPTKPKTHECSICGAEFALGQALGGHMRRHQATMKNSENHSTSNNDSTEHLMERVTLMMPILKRSNSSKRVLSLDLNLKLGW